MKGLKRFRRERLLHPDLCDANPVLYQLSYQVHWKLVVMWVNDKPASR